MSTLSRLSFKIRVLLNNDGVLDKEIDIEELGYLISELKYSADMPKTKLKFNYVELPIKSSLLSELSTGLLSFNKRALEQAKSVMPKDYGKIDDVVGASLHLPYFREILEKRNGITDVVSAKYEVVIPSGLSGDQEDKVLNTFFGTPVYDSLSKKSHEPLTITTKINVRNQIMNIFIPCISEIKLDLDGDKVIIESRVPEDYLGDSSGGLDKECVESSIFNSDILNNDESVAHEIKQLESLLLKKVTVVIADNVSKELYNNMLGTENSEIFEEHSSELINLVKSAIIKDVPLDKNLISSVFKDNESGEKCATAYINKLKELLNG